MTSRRERVSNWEGLVQEEPICSTSAKCGLAGMQEVFLAPSPRLTTLHTHWGREELPVSCCPDWDALFTPKYTLLSEIIFFKKKKNRWTISFTDVNAKNYLVSAKDASTTHSSSWKKVPISLHVVGSSGEMKVFSQSLMTVLLSANGP